MDARFTVRDAGRGVGLGMFAATPIKKGKFILEYTGVRITSEEAEEHSSRYLFELDDKWTLDGEVDSNVARFINHSCDPNCEAEIEDDRIMIYALKDIGVGEELSFDYDQEYFDEFIKPIGCKCGAKKHRQ